ncbi:MAG: ABC transporter substrate-binding protein [Pseudomonadota bacterium]
MKSRAVLVTAGAVALAAAFMVSGGLFGETALGFNEAPMLAERVKAGKLPAIDKRLPPCPAVVTPLERVGRYGGTWRRAYTGVADLVGVRRVLYDPLVRWSPTYELLPNLAEKWTVSEDGKVFTFNIVKGIRWSDGEPFTAGDILFYFEDILLNKELSPSAPQWLAPGGKAPKIAKLDDYTFSVEFESPYSLFLQQLACPQGMELVTKPKHYLKKFHKKYAQPEELAKLLAEKNSSSWVKLFQDVSSLKDSLFINTEMPSICAWVTKVPAPAKRFIMERNPYYWKVDPAGNQLPYIDCVVHDLQAEGQTIVLKAIAGEIDMQGRRLGGMQNSVLLLANKAEGKFKLVPKISTASVGMLLAPNLNHQDPAMKAVLSDARVRKALSHAINRSEINKIIYRGKGLIRQAAPLKESAFYSPTYEKAYTEHDLTKAAALLEEAGFKTGPDGKRNRPDGQPLRLTLDVMVGIQTWVDTAEIVASNFARLGIDTEVKSESRELFQQRMQTSAHDIALWSGDGGMECLLEPRWYFPYDSNSLHAPYFAQWYQTGGAKGQEPPTEIKECMQAYGKILTTVSSEEQKKLFASIMALNEKNLWVIGLVGEPPDFYVAAPNMFNLPKKDFQSWIYPNPGPIWPEQFFFDKAVK